MRRGPLANLCLSASFVLVSASAFAQGAKPTAAKDPAAAPAKDAVPAPPKNAAATPAAAGGPDTRSAAMAAYNRALSERRLETSSALTPETIRERLLEAQELSAAGRRSEEIGMLVRLVESPRFADYADSGEGHAAVYALGNALATEGAHEPARGYLRRLLAL